MHCTSAGDRWSPLRRQKSADLRAGRDVRPQGNIELERFAQSDRTTAQKVRDALHDLVQKVRALLSGKGEKALDETQRAMFRELDGRTDEMARLFDAALDKVQENEKTEDSEAAEKEEKPASGDLPEG